MLTSSGQFLTTQHFAMNDAQRTSTRRRRWQCLVDLRCMAVDHSAASVEPQEKSIALAHTDALAMCSQTSDDHHPGMATQSGAISCKAAALRRSRHGSRPQNATNLPTHLPIASNNPPDPSHAPCSPCRIYSVIPISATATLRLPCRRPSADQRFERQRPNELPVASSETATVGSRPMERLRAAANLCC